MREIINLSIIKNTLRRFFMSFYYPLFVGLAVLLGHIFGIELYLGALNVILAALSLLVCDTVKPFIPFMLTFIYQVPLKHTPGIPTWSDYYFSGGALAVIIVLSAVLGFALAYRSYKVLRGSLNLKSPMMAPLIFLSAAFLLNGAFSSEYSWFNAIFGAAQVFVYFLLFYLFLYGLKGESLEGIVRYLVYSTVLSSLVLFGEMIFMYATYDNLFVNGAINKEAINLGWGIWNPIGASFAVLIPMQIYGAMKYKRPYVYLISVLLCYAGAVMTLSRNSIIFSTLTLAVSVIFACVGGQRRKMFRVIALSALGIFAIVGVIASSKLIALFGEIIGQGLSDNGRFDLWGQGIDNFLSSPVFGKGFFGFGENNIFEAVTFIPDMAHNTVVELLSAMGVVGLIAYLVYRVKSLTPFFKTRDEAFRMMLISVGTLLVMSLLDNFVFYFYTVFYYVVIMAICHKYSRDAAYRKDPFGIEMAKGEDSYDLDVKISDKKLLKK